MKVKDRHLILCHNPKRVEEYAKENGWTKRDYTHVHYKNDLLGISKSNYELTYLDCNFYNSSHDLMDIADYAEDQGFRVIKIENPNLKLNKWHTRPKNRKRWEPPKFEPTPHRGRF